MKLKFFFLVVLFSNSLLSESEVYRIDKNCSPIIEIQKKISKDSSYLYLNLFCKQRRSCLSKLNEMLPIFKSSNRVSESEAEKEFADNYSSWKYLTITCNEFGFVSVMIYTHGVDRYAMHSLFHYHETYVAHIRQDKLLTLNDLVYATPEFWDFLSREISKSINSPNAEIPKKEDFKVFTLSDTHIIFIIKELLANESFSGSIPISRIQKFLKPEIKKIYNLQ